MDKKGIKAYALAISTFQKCEEDHPQFSPADSLLGVVTDWRDAAEISSSLSVVMSLLCHW